jgi:hypothetical protein
MDGALFVIAIALCIFLFSGEPDLHDKLMTYLDSQIAECAQ